MWTLEFSKTVKKNRTHEKLTMLSKHTAVTTISNYHNGPDGISGFQNTRKQTKKRG